jgi:hypothetical protein
VILCNCLRIILTVLIEAKAFLELPVIRRFAIFVILLPKSSTCVGFRTNRTLVADLIKMGCLSFNSNSYLSTARQLTRLGTSNTFVKLDLYSDRE